MGSRLEKKGQILWGDSIWTMKDRFEELALPADLSDDGVRPAGAMTELRVVGGVVKIKQYSELLDHLRSAGLRDGKTLFVFDYDWRRSSADSARQLARQIDKWRAALGNPDVKFRIVAHSMGGLVAKYYINRLDGHLRVDRLILVGTPSAGSVKSLMMFRGGLLDDQVNSFLGEARVRRVLRTFPSAYELLPRVRSCCLAATGNGAPESLNIFTVTPWQQYRWIEFSPAEAASGWKFVEERLRSAQDFHHSLAGIGSKGVAIFKIVGYTQRTIEQILVNSAVGKTQIVERWGPGDGTVTVESARVGDLQGNDGLFNVQRVAEKHGSLYADREAKETIVDLVRDHKPQETLFATAQADFGQADVTLDRSYYSAGAIATLTVDLRDPNGAPLAPESVSIRVGANPLAAAAQAADAGPPQRYRFAAPESEGTYEVHVSIKPAGLPAMQVTEMFEVIR